MLKKPFPKINHIHAITVPFQMVPDMMTANVFAVGKGPITLIDAGLKTPGPIEYIQEGVNAAGCHLNDIERIVITHGHPDHFGLAARIRDMIEHPIEVFIHPEDAWRVSPRNFEDELWAEGFEDLRAIVDMPKDELEKLKQGIAGFYLLCDPLTDVSFMEDGDEFDGDGYHLQVFHTPGHSPGMCCLYESTQRVLFSGDHILNDITPNPIIETNRDGLRDPNYQSLKAYRDSLEKIAGLDVKYVFPGHGEYSVDLPEIISRYRDHHQQRMDFVLNVIKKKTLPLYHLISEVFPNASGEEAFLALSEIIAHLEVLINEGRAELIESGPPALYRAL